MWFKKKSCFQSPISGTLIPLSQVNDPTFAEGMMGSGFAIIPKDGELLSPCNGTIKMIFPTKHAIGIACQDGNELLIHVGIDTVELQGTGFVEHVAQGDHVSAGTVLLTIDLSLIKEQGYDPTVILAFPSNPKLKLPTTKEVIKGQELNIL